jgi:hypothetical protein
LLDCDIDEWLIRLACAKVIEQDREKQEAEAKRQSKR